MFPVELEFINECYVRIIAPSIAKSIIKSSFTFYAENYQNNPRYLKKVWDGKTCLVKEDKFPMGLLPELMNVAKKYNLQVSLKFGVSLIKGKFKEDVVRSFMEKLKVVYPNEITPHDFQEESIIRSITYKRGINLLPTSAGKSFIIYNIVQFLRYVKAPVLVIVPNTNLVEQLYSDFLNDYNWHDLKKYVTRVHSQTKPDYTKPIVITTYQSLEKKPDEFFEAYKGVIIDEVQYGKCKTLQEITSKCINAEYRIGFTGTLPPTNINVYKIVGSLGPIIVKRITKDLQDKGIVSKLQIKNILLKYPYEFLYKMRNRGTYEEVHAVEHYEDRNKVLKYILSNVKDNQNVLILCQRIEHFEEIFKYLRIYHSDNYTLKKIRGGTSIKEQTEVRLDMEKEANTILLGTYGKLAAGFSVKNLHHVVFMSSYKTPIKVLQSIGRALRKHPTKDCATLWDVVDDFRYMTKNGTIKENNLYGHWKVRMNHYKNQKFESETLEIALNAI